MSEVCAAAEFLREGGPRSVPFRVCCVAAIVRAGYDMAAAARADDDDPYPCAAMDLTIPADAASIVGEARAGQPG